MNKAIFFLLLFILTLIQLALLDVQNGPQPELILILCLSISERALPEKLPFAFWSGGLLRDIFCGVRYGPSCIMFLLIAFLCLAILRKFRRISHVFRLLLSFVCCLILLAGETVILSVMQKTFAAPDIDYWVVSAGITALLTVPLNFVFNRLPLVPRGTADQMIFSSQG